jgi:hypothetical protein
VTSDSRVDKLCRVALCSAGSVAVHGYSMRAAWAFPLTALCGQPTKQQASAGGAKASQGCEVYSVVDSVVRWKNDMLH